MRITGQWQGGFQAAVIVTAGSRAITSWTVAWQWPGNQSVDQAWNATVTSSGSAVTARNVSYNGSLAAGGTAEFGFLGSASSTPAAPALTCTA
ncbi:cellulose binding domain-containing protein [Paractinoplanes ferrugineus]|uniref:cellulose binding domain-containing protein n=1 Tax=Paractinoplanes ferrugineus TaxID=113564 RepID=UPI0023B26312|nr:cellulose binding domain-containing protein [Actinoplanes ferrugineus]